jgi:hypothetical protein
MSQVDECRNSPTDRSKILPPVNKNDMSVTGKRVCIPDVGDRTLNDPCYLMSSNDTLKLANQENLGDVACELDNFRAIREGFLEKKHLNNRLFKFLISAAKEQGWGEVKLVGKQLLFIAPFVGKVLIDEPPTPPTPPESVTRVGI